METLINIIRRANKEKNWIRATKRISTIKSIFTVNLYDSTNEWNDNEEMICTYIII